LGFTEPHRTCKSSGGQCNTNSASVPESGNQYASEYVLMRPTPDIEKVSTRFEEELIWTTKGVYNLWFLPATQTTTHGTTDTNTMRHGHSERLTTHTLSGKMVDIVFRGNENINTCWKSSIVNLCD
jgi:hypothetical protein